MIYILQNNKQDEFEHRRTLPQQTSVECVNLSKIAVEEGRNNGRETAKPSFRAETQEKIIFT